LLDLIQSTFAQPATGKISSLSNCRRSGSEIPGRGITAVFTHEFEHLSEFPGKLDEPLLIDGFGRCGIKAQTLVKGDGLME
jgi:hypothetical protein